MNKPVDPAQTEPAAPVVAKEVLEQLRGVSTATLATALFKRGLRNQMIQGVHALAPMQKNMVGIAFTLRYIPAREDLNPISVFGDAEHPQRKAIESCPSGAVLVIDSRGNAANGAAAAQAPWDGGNNQQWRLNDTGNGRVQIINRGTGTALDGMGNATAGSTVAMWTPNTSTNNLWTLTTL